MVTPSGERGDIHQASSSSSQAPQDASNPALSQLQDRINYFEKVTQFAPDEKPRVPLKILKPPVDKQKHKKVTAAATQFSNSDGLNEVGTRKRGGSMSESALPFLSPRGTSHRSVDKKKSTFLHEMPELRDPDRDIIKQHLSTKSLVHGGGLGRGLSLDLENLQRDPLPNSPHIRSVKDFKEENGGVNSKENKLLRKEIRKELRTYSIPKAPQEKRKRSLSGTLAEFAKSSSQDKPAFEMIQERLISIIESIIKENASRDNEWVKELFNSVNDLIIREPAQEPSLKNQQLKVFLSKYEEVQKRHSETVFGEKIIDLINRAIGGKSSASDIIAYLKKLHGSNTFQLNFDSMKQEFEDKDEPNSPCFLWEIDLSSRQILESDEAEAFDRDLLLKLHQVLPLFRNFIDVERLSNMTAESTLSKLESHITVLHPNFKYSKLSLDQLIDLIQVPEISKILTKNISRKSTLLIPPLCRLKHALQTLQLHLHPLEKTTPLANELHFLLTALFNLDDISVSNWNEIYAPFQIIHKGLPPLGKFIQLLTQCLEKPAIVPILSIIFLGDENASLRPLIQMLSKWQGNQLDLLNFFELLQEPGDGVSTVQEPIRRITFSPTFKAEDILRSLFGRGDIALKKMMRSAVFEVNIKVNGELIDGSALPPELLEAEIQYCTALLEMFKKHGFLMRIPPIRDDDPLDQYNGCISQIVHRLVEMHLISQPELNAILGFSSISGLHPISELVINQFPLVPHELYTINRKNEKIEAGESTQKMEYNVRGNHQFNCLRIVNYTIYKRLFPDDEGKYLQYDHERPIAHICYPCIAYIEYDPRKKTYTQHYLWIRGREEPQYKPQFTEHATRDDIKYIEAKLGYIKHKKEKPQHSLLSPRGSSSSDKGKAEMSLISPRQHHTPRLKLEHTKELSTLSHEQVSSPKPARKWASMEKDPL